MISWTSLEFQYHEKDSAWSALVIVVAVVVGIFALWQHNILFLIFIAIAATLMVVWGRRAPRPIQFILDHRGLMIGKRHYPYREFIGFALSDEVLQIHQKSRLHSRLTITIPPDKELEIREFLLAFLPEVEYTESFIENLSHLSRF